MKYISPFLVCFSFGVLAAIPTTPGWYGIPNTTINSVCAATNGFPAVRGASGCGAITAAWNSGVFDSKRNRLIIWGGGHNDYYGNEIYALNLNGQSIERLNDPSPRQDCTDGGGLANSRHTNDGITYMTHADKMFVQGGVPACPTGYFSDDTWVFDFSTMQWEKKNPSGPIPRARGLCSAYDPNSKRVFVDDGQGLFAYTLETNSYVRVGNSGGGSYTNTAIVDPAQKKLFIFGAGGNSVCDISPGSNYSWQSFSASGGGGIAGAQAPAISYDTDRNRIIGWSGGSTVYTLDVDSRAWTSHTYSGGPGSQVTAGSYKRCGYSAESGVFVLYNQTSQNGYTFRFPGSTGAEKAGPRLTAGLSVYPNPMGKTGAGISVNREVFSKNLNLSVRIYSPEGKVVFQSGSLKFAQGTADFRWNGKNMQGKGVRPGLYVVKVTGAGVISVQPLIVM